ncbi:NADH-quinone oxidoreductase subunit L [Futiania mangrovi]|uniref:NADH-quinone oxidoreductase subunit L n=1 Tax=Futiania mangrovi TaxID=2959716 RepID=A0A9J6PD54_9PROT|nr:NADH-quinone oxidoreductase subunit L [Futiania mangrovii]MCP1335603.1 NADH-quinone oxidoreductase subunit L [Futiania mangrovii]
MYSLIVFLPLVGAIVAGLFGRLIGDRAAMGVTTGGVIVSAVLSAVAFFTVPGGETQIVPVLPWIASGEFVVDWSLRIDTLTAVMLIVVNGVSALVHVYSIGYMSHDPHRARFFAYLSLFTFAMLMLVTANNLLQMFFGWEGVGLASYLLIGFWYTRPSANAAAMKAFIVNRVGDFGYALGIMAIFFMFGSIEFDAIFAAAPDMADATFTFLWMEVHALTAICVLLFIGAMGKSAQLFLHTWLPDAMEGPTPVSALIHAATMVTAGVFLVCRMSPLFEMAPYALAMVAFIGATTAFFAATIGLVQNDIKRVIAYSTCSQLGYMFFAAGVGAYQAAMFHLFTHAFFKALLFLCAGSVIHALHDEQDMRRMGGMRKVIPHTFWLMVIGTVALTGIGIPGTPIGLSGFFSKDMIVEVAYASENAFANYAFWLGVIGAGFTSFYSWRLIFMTFFGEYRGDPHAMEKAHESPAVMLVPLYILAVGSVLAGGLFWGRFVGVEEQVHHFWNAAIAGGLEVLEAAHHVPFWVKAAPFVATMIGLALSWQFYIRKPEIPVRLAREQDILYRFLLNKWYFDEIYDALIVRPALCLGRLLWKGGDGRIIDGTIDGISMRIVPYITGRAVRLQSGYVYHYAFAMLIGVAVLVSFFLMTSGGH